MTRPGGTLMPLAIISASPAALSPSASRMVARTMEASALGPATWLKRAQADARENTFRCVVEVIQSPTSFVDRKRVTSRV